MRLSTPRLLVTLSASALITFLGGCATTSSPATSAGSTTTKVAGSSGFDRESAKRLRIGMFKTQVIDLLGEPMEITPSTVENEGHETWTYLHTTEPVYREVAIELEEVAYVDPVTGIARTILDPRQEMERITVRETYTLVFNQDELLADLNYDSTTSRSR